jgi:WD40 repeat protein
MFFGFFSFLFCVQLQAHTDSVNTVQLDCTGRQFYSAGEDGTVRVWG